MAVSSNLTSLETFESPGATFNNIGSGGGAADNTDVFIEGAQSGGRRVDNATDKGFMATISSTDLSGANEHVKIWVFCFHWSAVTGLTARLRSGTNVYDNHEYGSANIPIMGGWIPLWVDVSRTPDSQGSSGSANEAAITDIGAYIDIGNVGGAGDNFIIDEIMHGTSGYTWSGASGDFADFTTYEDTNVEGVFLQHLGAQLCFARLELSDTASTTFTDSGFAITFPDQPLISTTFMGITVDLTHASTAVTLSNGAFVSDDPVGATNRFDILIQGTNNGTFDMDTMLINGARTIELNQQCSLTDSVILNSGVVDATVSGTSNGADLSGSSFIDSTVAANESAVIWDVNADPDGEMDGCSFDMGTNSHHAITFGTNIPTTMTLRDCDFTGFSGTDDVNNSIFKFLDTTGTFTLNLINCTNDGGGFSVDSRAGCTVNVVVDPVTTLVNVKDETGTNLQNARVYLKAADNSGPLPFEDSVTISRSGTVATVTHTAHGMVTNDKVVIKGITDKTEDNNGVKTITRIDANSYSYTTTDSGSTSYTGTIISTWVALEQLSDASGNASISKTYSGNQPVDGWIRMSTSSPRYKSFPISGTIDSSTGLTINVQMIPDE